MSEGTEREVVINHHSTARIHLEPDEKFVFHPITSASWVTKRSEGFERRVESGKNIAPLTAQQITEQTFLCFQELKKLDESDKAGREESSIGWISYPEVDKILTETAKRYIESLQVNEEDQFVSRSAATEGESEEGSRHAAHIDTSQPITLDEPFNHLPWRVDLDGTGFKMGTFKSANHPMFHLTAETAFGRTERSIAKMGTSLKMEPEVRPELFSLAVDFVKPTGDEETGSLRLVGQARIRDLYIDLDEGSLQTLKSTVEAFLSKIEPTSDHAVTIRGTGELPRSSKKTLLDIGAPIFQSGNYTGDQLRAMTNAREPIFLELSVPSLQPRALTADTVYDKARVTALNSLDTEFDPEYQNDEEEKAGRASLANLYNSTIEQLKPIRPSEAPLTHWSDTANRVMVAVTRNAESKITDGFGTKYTFEPKLTTWQYDGESTSPRGVARLAIESNLEDATHVKVQVFKHGNNGEETGGGEDEELVDFIGRDMFPLMPTDSDATAIGKLSIRN
jgi:hypothetical protein